MAVAVFLSLQARYGANAPSTVIFVVMDTLRADRASLCGYAHPTTPKLEALVERGASYACNSHAPSTWTLPSHATLFHWPRPRGSSVRVRRKREGHDLG